jgi:ABC-type polysaccharide/polyol phosphate transport system ATPase subunit
MRENQISLINSSFFRKLSTRSKQNRTYVIADANIEIRFGDRIGLIGPNGSGKTTLLRLMSGIFQPDSGSVILNTDVMTILDAGFGLDHALTGRENTRTLLILGGIERSDRVKTIEFIEEFSELGQYFDQPVKNYSSGMLIRLVLAAQIAMMDKKGLIIDEGFGTADAAFQRKTFDRIEQMLIGVPFIVIASHNEQMLRDYCTRGIVVENGKIQFDGSIEQALDHYHQAKA